MNEQADIDNQDCNEVNESEERLRKNPDNPNKKLLYKMLAGVLLLLLFGTGYGFIKNKITSPKETDAKTAISTIQSDNRTQSDDISYRNEKNYEEEIIIQPEVQNQQIDAQLERARLEEQKRAWEREEKARLEWEKELRSSNELGRKSTIKFDLGQKKTTPKEQQENNYYNSQQDTYYVEVIE